MRRLADMAAFYMNSVFWAPPNEGDTGGGGDGDDSLESGEGDDTLDGSESDDNTEINVDGLDAITKLFADTPGTDDDDDDSNEKILTADEVKNYLDEGLKKVVFSESLIPDDFNPNDKKSLTALLSSAMQLGTRHALNLMFRPVENAMKSHAKEVRADVKGRVNGLRDNTSTEKFLAREIPASQNPKYSNLVNTAWKNALEIHKKPEDRPKAVAMVKAGLKAMNIVFDDAGESRGRRGESGGSLRTGEDALNLYAPKPKAASTSSALRK